MSDRTVPAGPWGAMALNKTVPAGTEPENDLTVGFSGSRWALFWLALKTGFFTILTLGFYRFWMKTRLRRWYWSAIRPGGHPLEYVGDPIEKLLGFFIAVVILTFYIGILNLLLMFASFSLFSSSVIGYVASFAGVIPLWFYARYRARRYVLGRTRWRGVRFGLEPGAWGYAWRALVHWAITICTLGVLWPRMTFWLEKYRTDRTFFGSVRLEQGGSWRMLYKSAVPFVLATALAATMTVHLVYIEPLIAPEEGLAPWEWFDAFVIEERVDLPFQNTGRLIALGFALAGMLFGAIFYRWDAKRLMANHKSAPGIQFASRLNGLRVVFIYAFGNFLSYLVLVIGLSAMLIVAMPVFLADTFGASDMAILTMWEELSRWLRFGILAVLYLSAFLLWGVLHNTFVTFPIMRHMAKTTTLTDASGLKDISQRARDEFAEAEGFAEALDLGAAI